tara:strand:+ start:3861 stop:4490 length:630 start_codon:yes stop_codon:yes gene_type:complete
MITKALKVPNSLSEITLGQYQKFNKVLSEEPDEDFLQKKTIEIFCQVNLADVNQYKYSSIVQVIEIINKMFEQKPTLIKRFKHKGDELAFIPKLDEMSFGEFVDLDLLLSDWETMDEAMAVLYRKIEHSHKNNYTIEAYDSDKTQDMKSMPLDVALSSLFFLESLSKELTNHILLFLENKVEELPTEQKLNLLKTSAGGQVSGLLARVI